MSDKKQTQKKSNSTTKQNVASKKTKNVDVKAEPQVAEPVVIVSEVVEPVVNEVVNEVVSAPNSKSKKTKKVNKDEKTKSKKKVVEPEIVPVTTTEQVNPVVVESVAATETSPSSKSKTSKNTVKSKRDKKKSKASDETDKKKKPLTDIQENEEDDGVAADDTTSSKNRRFFRVIVDGTIAKGRFRGTKPKQAANKALTSIIRTMKSEGKDTTEEIKFSIKECTRGGKGKEYRYIGRRQELIEPMKVEIGKKKDPSNIKTISYKYNNKVMKDKTPLE